MLPQQTNIRPVGFEVSIAATAEAFFLFGPLAPGEEVRGCVFELGSVPTAIRFWAIDISIFASRPAMVSTDFGDGTSLVSGAGALVGVSVGASATSDVRTFRLPVNIVGSDNARYIAVRIGCADFPTEATQGSLWFDVAPLVVAPVKVK